MEQLDKEKKAKVKKKKSKTPKGFLENNKVSQIMLKTALRNHIDLSHLADNKASTLLSVNALMITLVLPLMIPLIQDNINLGLPTGILLLSCVISIILSTLVTMPSKLKGVFSIEDIKEGTADPFFFGNFHNMSYNQYLSLMKETIEETKILEESAIDDLYMSGKVLGKKFTLLRICYGAFLLGLTISGCAFYAALCMG